MKHFSKKIKIRIAKEYLSPHNKELLKRDIWGSETFTSNSDAVCILKHSGLIDFANTAALKNYEGVAFFCKITKGFFFLEKKIISFFWKSKEKL